MSYPPLPTGRRIGFWVSDDDVYGGDPVFGNAKGTVPTPQQFFNAYFLGPAFPASMVWTGGLYSSAAHSVPPAQEAQWLNQLLTICDGYPNIRVWAIFFINLSGYFIETAQFNVSPGFTIKRVSPLTSFTIASTAGLAPNTQYTLQEQDINRSPLATVTTFTTDATGAASFAVGIPNVTDAQAAQGIYVQVLGTSVQAGLGGQNDQTADFQNYMNTIKGHPSFVGALFEPEYFGNTPSIQATFDGIVQGAGYYVLGSTNSPSTGFLVMRYSSYPYFGGALYTGTAPSGELGAHYGETGAPIPPDPQPIWTQAVVQNIVANSEVAPITIIISMNDKNNTVAAVAPAYQDASGTDWYLYMSPVLRGWVSSDPAYASFLLSNGSVGPTPTTLTLTAKPI